MPFKYNADGTIATSGDGDKKLPLFVHPDGREAAFDADATLGSIARLNGEAKSHRERAEAAEGKLKTFDGLTDAEAARKALETVKNIKDGELIAAGKVEEIKTAARTAAEERVAAAARQHVADLAALKADRDGLQTSLHAEKIGNAFARSKFIAERMAIPPDLVQARFGGAFVVEEGKIVAKDAAGNKVFSSVRPGELADVDEALEILVAQYPYRTQILKGSGASGGGALGGGSPGAGGKRTYTRAQFDALPLDQKRAVANETAQGKAAIVD